MAVIGLSNISHRYGDDSIFENVSLGIESHHRIGLIGKNGTGKTTFLEIISGGLVPSVGTVHSRKGLNVSYLKQSLTDDNNQKLITYVMRSHERVNELTTLICNLETKLQVNPLPEYVELLDKYQSEFTALEGYSLDYKANMILQQLSFSEQDRQRQVKSFSGGERTRIELAKILLSPSDILLLDEPTNYLDLIMIDWLENFLKDLYIPYIIVSHDRHFLDKTVSTILSIEDKNIVSYSGNYSFYEKEYKLRQDSLMKAFVSQQAYIEKTEEFIRKNLAGQKTKQAKSRIKTLSKIDKIARPETESALKMNINSAKRSGNIVYTLENTNIGFADKTLVNDINKTITYRDRIAVIGKNGSGKTTFLQTLLGEKKVLKGNILKGTGITIAYYDQLHINLNKELNVYDTISYEHTDWTKGQIMSYLAGFGFYDDDLNKTNNMLSGGERARLYLALLISRQPNVLIMDEPTNHLDVFMIDSLENALVNYNGTLVFVSHDRVFINNIANRFWLLKDGQLQERHNWEELLFAANKESQSSCEKAAPKQERIKNRKPNPIVLTKKLEQIKDMEDKIGEKNKQLLQLNQYFMKKETFSDGEKVKELNNMLQTVKNEINHLTCSLHKLEDEYLLMSEE